MADQYYYSPKNYFILDPYAVAHQPLNLTVCNSVYVTHILNFKKTYCIKAYQNRLLQFYLSVYVLNYVILVAFRIEPICRTFICKTDNIYNLPLIRLKGYFSMTFKVTLIPKMYSEWATKIMISNLTAQFAQFYCQCLS